MPKPATPTSTTSTAPPSTHAAHDRADAARRLTGNPLWPAGHGIVTSIQDMPISRTPYGLALRVDNDQDIPTRILVVEQAVTQVLQVARVARPEAFTDPVTAHVDGYRLMSRPR